MDTPGSHRVARRASAAAAVLLLTAALTACAAGPTREDAAVKSRYLDYAGQPIDTIDTLGRVTGWTSVSRTQLVIWTGVNEAWLIKVWDTCRDITFAESISVSRSGSKITRFDKVLVGPDSCPIAEIRPIDVKQMKADRAAAKAKP
ncbi:MAG: DUF6491 family protein [Gammaproteobacteria bacterium]